MLKELWTKFISAVLEIWTIIVTAVLRIWTKIIITILKTTSRGALYITSHWMELLGKLVYIIILIIILQAIFVFSLKAWLYPIKLYQYYDECSYLSMAKYFRIYNPVTLVKDYLLKDKALPPLYHEFHSRAYYWSFILSLPMKYSTDVEYLHHFRALFLTIGTLVFFFIGHKLGGLTGGVAAAAFWIGTPILNYWGKFFMTGIPSLVFMAAGYLFLLYSDRWRLSALLGGFFIGFGAFTRFTTILIAFPAPFIILAVFFSPFKRKSFQLTGELAKAFAGFGFGTLPFLIFSGLIYRNPLQPFYAARSAVNQSPADDPGYYIRNIWVEVGPLVRIGALLSILAVVLLAISWGLKQGALNEQKKKNSLLLLTHVPRAFVSGLLYHGIILVSLIVGVSIYLMGITGIPHKLPRYIIGAVIPLIIIASMGFGAFEKLILQFIRLPLQRINNVLNDSFKGAAKKIRTMSPLKEYSKMRNSIIKFYLSLKKLDPYSFRTLEFYKSIPRYFVKIFPSLRKKIRPLCNIWIIIGFIVFIILGVSIYYLKNIPMDIWNYTMNRSGDYKYIIPEDIVKKTASHSLRRLQPEYNFASDTPAGIAWDMSINEKLKLIKEDPEKQYSTLRYLYGSYLELYEELNNLIKSTEVLYVDRDNLIPFTPGYIKKATIWIDDHVRFGYSLSTLIRRGYFPYNGYVIVHRDSNEEFFKNDDSTTSEGNEKAYDYFRSINLPAVRNHKSFTYVKTVSWFVIYRYNGGIPFPDYPEEKPLESEKIVKTDNTSTNENTSDKETTPGTTTDDQTTPDTGESIWEKIKKKGMELKEEHYNKLFEFWLPLFEEQKNEENS